MSAPLLAVLVIAGAVIFVLLLVISRFFRVVTIVGSVLFAGYFGLSAEGRTEAGKLVAKITNARRASPRTASRPRTAFNSTRMSSSRGSGYHSSSSSRGSSSRRTTTRSSNSVDARVGDAERQMEQICDPLLGRGRTGVIMDIAKDDRRSSRAKTRDIVRATPTGLPGPVDGLVKSVALGLAGRITK